MKKLILSMTIMASCFSSCVDAMEELVTGDVKSNEITGLTPLEKFTRACRCGDLKLAASLCHNFNSDVATCPADIGNCDPVGFACLTGGTI